MDAILVQALPEAIAGLAKLSRSPNRRTARRALNALLRHLHDPRSITVTAALGADAACVHLAAIAWVEGRQAELIASRGT